MTVGANSWPHAFHSVMTAMPFATFALLHLRNCWGPIISGQAMQWGCMSDHMQPEKAISHILYD